MFFEEQEEYQKHEYVKLLRIVGSLSHLFSDSPIPYLNYRIAENIFCRAFDADNISRGDVSADAAKNRIGLGLKTFLHKNGATYQKVAEFNKGMFKYHTQEIKSIIETISTQRNKRIKFTARAYGIDHMIYHLVTRERSLFRLYEESMDLVDIDSISSIKRKDNIIYFKDKNNNYKFNMSKSTLFKQFITDKSLCQFEVPILEDPFAFLLESVSNELEIIEEHKETFEHIYLPLYSVKTKKVEEKSGLNQWNASGRKRHVDEVYIPIPIWIHRKYKGFFPYDLDVYQAKKRNNEKYESEPFTLELPDGSKLSARICQENGKALMSNPNKELGKWLLRHVLELKPKTLVTSAMLEENGIDSVVVTKISSDYYRIDFAKVGSYMEFEEEHKK